MNTDMAQAFKTGAGIDPTAMKTGLMVIAVGVVLVVAAWIVLKLMDAHAHGELESPDMVKGGIALLILVGLSVYVMT
mgnify:FL=1